LVASFVLGSCTSLKQSTEELMLTYCTHGFWLLFEGAENTQMTVNNQMVVGTLMNLADNPTRVSIGQDWRDDDIVNRVPIICTGNDFSKVWAPLIRDGRMDKFYW
jgi:hypothetical protein